MKAQPRGDEFILNGTKLFVPDAHTADFLICAVRMGGQADLAEGITLFVVDLDKNGMTVSLMPCMDGTRKLCAVEFKGVRVGPDRIIGQPHKGWDVLNTVLQRAQVGLCADSLGGAQKVMEMATQFAKDRVQFGQPIGAFQVIKHYCAQMYIEVESARSILYWAAWAQDYGDTREAAVAASAAKAYCSEVYRNVTARALQIMGATGFCWEQDIHLYFKRAKANEVTLGDPIYHREKVVQMIGA